MKVSLGQITRTLILILQKQRQEMCSFDHCVAGNVNYVHNNFFCSKSKNDKIKNYKLQVVLKLQNTNYKMQNTKRLSVVTNLITRSLVDYMYITAYLHFQPAKVNIFKKYRQGSVFFTAGILFSSGCRKINAQVKIF